MAEYVSVAKVGEIAPGQMKRVKAGNVRVCLANVGGQLYALKDECGHQKVALSRGTLKDHVVECPLHFAQFDTRTGKVLSGPDFSRVSMPGMDKLPPEAMERMQRMAEMLHEVECDNVPSYPVKTDNGTVLVKVE